MAESLPGSLSDTSAEQLSPKPSSPELSTKPSSPELSPKPSMGPSATQGRPRVVAAAVEPARRSAVIAALNQVVAAGGSALLVTADGRARPPGLAPEVETLDLAAGERQLGLNRLLVRDLARLLDRLAGRPVRGGVAPAWGWVRASKPYRMLRPWLLWRVLRRRLAEVRVGDVDHVIIVHQNSWPIAWQLHHRNPAITIAYELPESLVVNPRRSE